MPSKLTISHKNLNSDNVINSDFYYVVKTLSTEFFTTHKLIAYYIVVLGSYYKSKLEMKLNVCQLFASLCVILRQRKLTKFKLEVLSLTFSAKKKDINTDKVISARCLTPTKL